MDLTSLAFDTDFKAWQLIVAGVALAVVVVGLVFRQMQRKKAGL